jgi:hypothetical protein
MGGACSTHGKDEKQKIVVGEAERKRPLGRSRCRWEGHIKLDLRDIGLEVVDWIHVALHMEYWRAHYLQLSVFLKHDINVQSVFRHMFWRW